MTSMRISHRQMIDLKTFAGWAGETVLYTSAILFYLVFWATYLLGGGRAILDLTIWGEGNLEAVALLVGLPLMVYGMWTRGQLRP